MKPITLVKLAVLINIIALCTNLKLSSQDTPLSVKTPSPLLKRTKVVDNTSTQTQNSTTTNTTNNTNSKNNTNTNNNTNPSNGTTPSGNTTANCTNNSQIYEVVDVYQTNTPCPEGQVWNKYNGTCVDKSCNISEYVNINFTFINRVVLPENAITPEIVPQLKKYNGAARTSDKRGNLK